MIHQPDGECSSVEKANAAFEEAAVTVIERARATSTPIVIWRDGKIVHLSPDEAEQLLEEHHRRKAGHEVSAIIDRDS